MLWFAFCRPTRACSGTNFWLHLMSPGSNAHVRWDTPQLHWDASVNALQLVEAMQVTQHVNAEVRTTRAVHHTDLFPCELISRFDVGCALYCAVQSSAVCGDVI